MEDITFSIIIFSKNLTGLDIFFYCEFDMIISIEIPEIFQNSPKIRKYFLFLLTTNFSEYKFETRKQGRI